MANRNLNTRVFWWGVLCCTFFYLFGIFAPLPSQAEENLYIGAGLPLSGKNESEGKAMQNALMMQIEQINKTGGIKGRQLELIVKDDANDKEKAKQVAREFAQDSRILTVIGHQFSSVSIAAGEFYQQSSLPHISPSASNPSVTRNRKWVFSMNYQDEIQGESMAVYLKVVFGAKNVAVIHSDDAYGMGLLESFSHKAKSIELGIQKIIPYSEDNKFGNDFIQRQWGKSQVDAIVLFAHTEDGAKLIKQLRQNGINEPAIGPDAFAKQTFIDALDKQTANVLVAGPFLYALASLKTKQFVDAYKQKYTEQPTVWAAFSYDALDMVIAALKAGNMNRNGIREYLSHIQSPEHAFQGITGKLFFDKYGAMERQIVVSMIDENQFKPAFTQIKQVTEAHILNNLAKKVTDGEVAIVDNTPYYLTRVVYAGIDYRRVNSVDIVNQNFDIEFFMWFRWVGNVDVNNIDFINGIYGVEDQKEILRKAKVGDLKYIAYKVKGTYLTNYNLRKFPFDSQTLPMTMAHKSKDANQLMLVVDHKNLSQTEVKPIYPEEWLYLGREDYSGTFEEHSTFGDPFYTAGDNKVDFSIYQANINIKRILLPYFVKLFLPLTIIIILSLFVFLISWDQFDARLTLVMTSLLSVLVFHMAQDEALPSVGYMVKADQFFLAAYILLFSLVTMTIAVNLLVKRGQQNIARHIDRWFSLIFMIAFPITFIYLTVTAL